MDERKSQAFSAALVFGVIGWAWITFSDRFVGAIAADPAVLLQLQTYKGWGFIAVCALSVFFTTRWVEARYERLNARLRESQASLTELSQRIEHYLVTSPSIVYARPFDGEGAAIAWLTGNVERILGYTVEEARAPRWWHAHIHPDEQAGALASLAELPHHEHAECEYRFRHKRGHYVWLRNECRLLRDAKGAAREVVGVLTDVSIRRSAEEEAHSKARQLDSIFLSDVDYMSITTVEGQILRLNRAWEELLGIDASAMQGRTLLEFVHPDDLGATISAVENFRGKGEVSGFVNRYRAADGNYRWMEWHSVPMGDFAYSVARDITGRLEAEERLRLQGAALEVAADGIYITGADGRILWCNEAFLEIAGATREEAMGQPIYRVTRWEQTAAEQVEAILEAVGGGRTWRGELVTLNTDGSTRHEELAVTPLRIEGVVKYYIGICQDITARKKAEEARELAEAEFYQSQKMEIVGRLAGGVAHDFNNMLSVILGYSEQALAGLEPGHALRNDLEEIRKAAIRSADLTRQLLTFSRKQVVQPLVFDLNTLVAEQEKMLRRLIGEDIQLRFSPGAGLWPIYADPTQAQQALANLCVNARDAIAGQGTILVETGNQVLDEATAKAYPSARPGEYVVLSVQDSGTGISVDILPLIFEPFFTTKSEGKGSGLGLSMVHSIMKQHEGFVQVQSEAGAGTTFRLYFPRAAAATTVATASAPEEAMRVGHETVLMVEDEESILQLAKRLLERNGYSVLATTEPLKAIALAREFGGTISILVTDLIMPEMNGRELQREIQKIKPDIRTLFMSGYTAEVISHQGMLDEGIDFLQKPFTLRSLSAKVREILDRPA